MKVFEQLLTIFEKGIYEYRRTVEKDIEQKYEFLKPIMDFIKIIKEISDGKLDENWALSTLSLTGLENVVNMKLKQLGEKISGEFSERVSKLKEALIKREKWDEGEASKLARKLVEKYRGRALVVHGGYENPTTKEVALEDLEFIKEITRKLFPEYLLSQ